MFAEKYLNLAQVKMYEVQGAYAKIHPNMGRISVIPVAVIDVVCEILKAPIGAIERIVVAALNLIGFLFSSKFTFKEFIFSAEMGLKTMLNFPITVCLVPVKLIYQIFAGIYDPQNCKSIAYHEIYKQNPVHYMFPQKV
jgi:hypothetical protein